MKLNKYQAFGSVVLMFTALLTPKSEAGEARTWKGSCDNGDKPGIGIVLVESDGKISRGDYYLLDPDKPGDFGAAGRKVQLLNIKHGGLVLHFTMQLGKGKMDRVLVFEGPLKGNEVKAQLQAPPEKDGLELTFRSAPGR